VTLVFRPPPPFWVQEPDGRPLHWSLALSRAVDAAERASDEGRPLEPGAHWLLVEGWRRLCVRRGLSPEQPRQLSCLPETLSAGLREGEPPHEGPVDSATLEPLPAQDWVTVARCGTWKDARIRRVFDERAGEGGWRMGYSWGPHLLDVRSGIELYEDGYTRVLESASHAELRAWVLGHRDIYDTAPSNTASFLDYSVQEVEGAGQHWQDIAVRRSLRRLGLWFQGQELLEIRGKESSGYRLNPGQLPFHAPHRIAAPSRGGWWREGSIEDFSVRNFAVQMRRDAALSWLERAGHSEDGLHAALVMGDPCVLPLLARWAQGADLRLRLALARAASLVPGAPDLPEPLRPQVQALAGWPAAQVAQLDRLLDPEPLGRAQVLEEPLPEVLLQVAALDPARKLRQRAQQRLAG
jgi:hypothetical protein